MLMAASASNLQQGNNIYPHHEDLVEHDQGKTTCRNLVPGMICPYGGCAVFFNVETAVILGTGATESSAAVLDSIGEMINATLISTGMSSMPGSKFVSGVCDLAISISTTTTGTTSGDNRISRRLQSGYIWKNRGVSHLQVWQFVRCESPYRLRTQLFSKGLEAATMITVMAESWCRSLQKCSQSSNCMNPRLSQRAARSRLMFRSLSPKASPAFHASGLTRWLLSLLIVSSFGNLICPVKVRRLPQLFNGFSWLRRCSSTWGFQLPTNHYLLHPELKGQRNTREVLQ